MCAALKNAQPEELHGYGVFADDDGADVHDGCEMLLLEVILIEFSSLHLDLQPRVSSASDIEKEKER